MCGLSIYLISNLTYHQRTHTGEMLSNITCVDCASLTIVIWNVTSTLILEKNPLRVTRVRYAFLTSISSLKRHLHTHCSLSYISSPYHCFVQMCPALHMSHFSLFDADVPRPTKVPLLIVWCRCALSYISYTFHCLMQMCLVHHKFHFSLFDADVPCPT